MKIGIVGYGNLGRGVELAVSANADMELVAVFTRRKPESVKVASGVPVVSIDKVDEWIGKVDVMILCGGSATDLPVQTPALAAKFNVIDSFDTHAKIPQHFATVDAAAKSAGKVAIISLGWDPGLFSLARAYANAILPSGADYTFWGKGVSQGHSDAIRRVPGVKDAKQYTVPVDSALDAVRSGANPTLTTRQKHRRECYVVLEDGANAAEVESAIKSMPNYFADYDTTVHFISDDELRTNHAGLAHGGFVIRSGSTSANHHHVIEFNLKLDSNPEFTASVLAAYARAAFRLNNAGNSGCLTAFDVAPALLSPLAPDALRASLL